MHDPKNNKPSRVGFKIGKDNKKVEFPKKVEARLNKEIIYG